MTTSSYRDTDEAVRILNDAGVPAINYHSGGGVMLAEVQLSPHTNGAPHIWIHDSSEQGEQEGLWSPGFYLRDDDEGDTIVAHNLTDGQLVGLCQQARAYYTDDAPNCIGLVKVTGHRGYYMGNIPNGHIAFAFTYLYEDGHAGLEVTVYDADGEVSDSQDFG